jgi:hypothetical protein
MQMGRIAVITELAMRVQYVEAMLATCTRFASQYASAINAFLRGNRRELYAFVTMSEQGRTKTTVRIIRAVNALHGVVDGNLEQIQSYIAKESKDEAGQLAGFATQISAARRSIEESRRLYVGTFASFSFSRPLFTDSHAFTILVAKLAKLSMTYVLLRVSKSWFERDVNAGWVQPDDLPAMVRRAVVLTLALDATLCGFFFALEILFGTGGGLWMSLVVDCCASDVVLLVSAAAISRVFAAKKYLEFKTNREKSLTVFVETVTYVACINACMPYFFML